MTHMIIPRLPSNAPFSPAERAWLDGYLAAFLGDADAPSSLTTAAPPSGEAPVAVEPDDMPWHDPSMAIDERMLLAEGRSRPRVLMAAMAQQDCGQCGYLCQSYAEALAAGAETKLTLCVPGGKETSRMLRELMATPAGALAIASPAPVVAPTTARHGGLALFREARRLNGEGSDKDTRHVVLQLEGGDLAYEAGDSFGVSVGNCPELVDGIIACLGASPSLEVDAPDNTRRELREALLLACDIARPADSAVEVLASRATGAGESDRLQALAEGYPGAEPADADLLDLLLAFPSARPPVQELISALGVLQPRLYSIASSPKLTPGEVHLTVATVRFKRRGRLRKGVASTFLAERAAPGQKLPAHIHRTPGFRLPKDGATPVIMIGPGTGVAPFRSFLAERRATGATGRNWLFFGDQRRAVDFLYEEELTAYHQDGLLTRLDVAFSRDQADKVYVQHRMREHARELYAWLEAGAHLYVCGDATRMAKDVDTALTLLIAKQGGMAWGGAKDYVTRLARDGRYQRDVY
jgi:sulfite reductase (NADPH) flavoprotein alpha-component